MDFLYFAYTSMLNKTEEDFWSSTPRKIFSQLDIYKEVYNKESKNKQSNNGIVQGETISLKAVD